MHLKVAMCCTVLLILLSWNEIVTFDCSNFLPCDFFVVLFQVENKNKILQLNFSFRECKKASFLFVSNENELLHFLLQLRIVCWWQIFKSCFVYVLYFTAFFCYIVLFCSCVYFHISSFLIMAEYRKLVSFWSVFTWTDCYRWGRIHIDSFKEKPYFLLPRLWIPTRCFVCFNYWCTSTPFIENKLFSE